MNGKINVGNVCQVFVPSAGILAEPIKFERSTYLLNIVV